MPDYMIEHSILPTRIIFSGSNITHMSIECGLKLEFLDSFKFMPMMVAVLPAAFGLSEACKGTFPYKFNVSENQEYMGPYPSTEYYGNDYKSPEDRAIFLTWHEGKKDCFRFQMRNVRILPSMPEIKVSVIHGG